MPLLAITDLPHTPNIEINLDSRNDEEFWEDAFEVSEFERYRPSYGGEPTTQKVARLYSDNDGLYLHWTVTDPEPSLTRGRHQRRDNIWRDDTVGVYLDTNGDAQRGYLFMCNPLGSQADAVLVPGQGDSFAWDERWLCSGRLTDSGYEVEMMIPWGVVRHPEEMDAIGISLLSTTARASERTGWPARSPDVSGILIQQALFHGPSTVVHSTEQTFIPDIVVSNGVLDNGRISSNGVSPGLTFTLSPTDSFSFLGTINPDFSTVESDEFQIEVNQRYALYFEEKRPFFTEGSEWLEFGFEDLIYTRSMVAPLGGVRADYERNNIRVSTLSVVDGAPAASVSEGTGWTEEDIGESIASSSIMRGRRSLGVDGYSGAIISQKSILSTGMTNLVAGGDTRVRLSDQASLAGSLISSRTSMVAGDIVTGNAGFIGSEWENAKYEMYANLYAVTPGFRSENGYVPVNDIMAISGAVTRNFYPENALFHRLELTPVDASVGWHMDGRLREMSFGPGISTQLSTNIYLHLGGGYSGELYEGEWINNTDVWAFVGGSPTQYLSLRMKGETGTTTLYDEDAPRSVQQLVTSARCSLALGRQLTLSAQLSFQQLEDLSVLIDQSWVSRIQGDFFVSKQLWTRVNLDISSSDEAKALEGLIAWELTPGRALYFGAGNPYVGTDEWQLFAKASWVFDR